MAQSYRTGDYKIARAPRGYWLLKWEKKPRDFGTRLIIAPECNPGWDHALTNREVRFGPVVGVSKGSPVKLGMRIAIRKFGDGLEFEWEGDWYTRVPNNTLQTFLQILDGMVPG